MIHTCALRHTTLSCKPRASGDDPIVRLTRPEKHRVNPARAGMILVQESLPSAIHRKPRASGDDPVKSVPFPDVTT